MRKPVFRVSDQARHKPGCTNTEDGKRLEILDLDSYIVEEELHHPCGENKGSDQHRVNREADLRLCFHTCKKAGFLMTWLI